MVIDSIKHFGEGSDLDPAVTQVLRNGASVSNRQGRLVIPGFVDGHMHFLLLDPALRKLRLGTCKNMDDISVTAIPHANANPSSPRIICRRRKQSTTRGMALASMLDPINERTILIHAKHLH